MPIDVACPPAAQLIAWLRCVKVRRLEFHHNVAAPRSSLSCLGYVSSEQRFRASVSTLLATLDFIKNSAPCLRVLSGVHPREGILYLTPFEALEQVTMSGAANEACKLGILQGLPRLREVTAAGYGDYCTAGLPPTVRRLDLQWAPSAASFSTVYFELPDCCQLEELSLSAQRPLCLPADCLARCASLRLAARRAYLGLPVRQGAPWADVDELAARFAQFMLDSSLEAVEVTATRFFVFQPVQDTYDLSTNEGLGGVAQHEQLATVILARHFQSLHVEQRMLAVGAFRAFMRITRRRAEPIAFSFAAPLNTEQLDFLQRHALATSIQFGPVSLSDAVAVLNCPAFARRNGALLRHLQHLEVSGQLDLAPYAALHSLQGTWSSEPAVPLGPAHLTSLRLTPPLGAQLSQRHFRTRWLAGVRQVTNLVLSRFACADFSHLTARPASVHMSALQPPAGQLTADTLQLPPGGFGPACSLTLRMAYAPPLAIQGGGGPQQQQHAGVQAGGGPGGPPLLFPGALAAALQQHAAAAAAAEAEAAEAAAAHQQPGQAQEQPEEPALAAPAAGAAPLQQQQQQQAQQQEEALFAHQQQAQQAQQAQQQAAHQQNLVVFPGNLVGMFNGVQMQHHFMVGPAGLPPPPPPLPPAAPGGGGEGQGQAGAVQDVLPPLLGLGEDEEVPELMEDVEHDGEEDEAMLPQQAGGGMGGGWVLVQPQQAVPVAPVAIHDGNMQQQQQAGLIDFGQPWAMPDDRLSDVTIRHEALFSAAGTLSVHAGALTVMYTGSGPEHLLRMLAGAGDSTLRTLRLNATALRFQAVPPKAGGSQAGHAEDAEQQPQQQQEPVPQQQEQEQHENAGPAGAAAADWQRDNAAAADGAAAAAAVRDADPGGQPAGVETAHSCSGSELKDYINTSAWAEVWEARLQRSMFRDQETLVLTRREGGSPAPALRLGAAAVPATRQ